MPVYVLDKIKRTSSGQKTVDVSDVAGAAGDGLEISEGVQRVKLDGSTLSLGEDGLKIAGNVPRFRGDWVSGTAYIVGDIVHRSSNVQQCRTANSDAAFTQSKWHNLTEEPVEPNRNGAVLGAPLTKASTDITQTEILSVTLTPRSDTKKVRVDVSVIVDPGFQTQAYACLLRGTTELVTCLQQDTPSTADETPSVLSYFVVDEPASDSEQTYKIRVWRAGNGPAKFGKGSSIVVEEL